MFKVTEVTLPSISLYLVQSTMEVTLVLLRTTGLVTLMDTVGAATKYLCL